PVRPPQGPASVPARDGMDLARGSWTLARRRGAREESARRGVAAGARPQAEVAHVARGGARPLRAEARPELPRRRDRRAPGALIPAEGVPRLSVQDRHGAAGPTSAQPAQDGRPSDLRVRRAEE